jgi:hypothetical protein
LDIEEDYTIDIIDIIDATIEDITTTIIITNIIITDTITIITDAI